MTGREKAIREIRRRKKEAEETLRLTLDALCQDEVFETLYRESNALKWDFVKARSDAERATLEDAIRLCEERLQNYIREKGLSNDVLRAPYSCKICNDTGVSDGKDCACVERLRQEIALSENPLLQGIPDALSAIDASFYREEAEKRKRIAEGIRRGMDGGKRYFLLVGTPGTGKTYFAATATRELMKSGLEVRALSAIALNKRLLEYHCAPAEKKRELWRVFDEADVLLIDDLGAEQVLNNVTIPYLLEILCERTDRITLITTNLSPADLEQRYGQRLVSRLLDKRLSMPILFEGSDLRF